MEEKKDARRIGRRKRRKTGIKIIWSGTGGKEDVEEEE